MRRWFTVVFCIAVCTPAVVLGGTPTPDPTFGSDGTVRIGSADGQALTPSASVRLRDGRLIIAAASVSGLAAFRFDTDGNPDVSFGVDGRTALPGEQRCTRDAQPFELPDGRLLLVVAVSTAALPCVDATVHVALLRADGTTDASHSPPMLPRMGELRPFSAVQDASGRVVIAGVGDDGQTGFTYLARLTAAGHLDTSFGGAGIVELERGPSLPDRAVGMGLLSNGGIVSVSLTGTTLRFSQLDATGSPIPVTNGATTHPIDLSNFAPRESLKLVRFFRLADDANLTILQREGAAFNALIIVRSPPDVAASGISLLISAPATTEWPAAAALLDGTVVIAETSETAGVRRTSLRRMFANSSFDPTWGVGRAYAGLAPGVTVTALAEGPERRLLALGTDTAGGFASRYALDLTPYYATSVALEYHNAYLAHYFMTADYAEQFGIEFGAAGPGWKRTGPGIRVHLAALGVPAGAVRVCRFYGNPEIDPQTDARRGPNSHVFILEGPECDAVRSDPGWLFEGYAFHMFAPVDGRCGFGQDPVYRAYNNRFAANDSNHRFTTSAGTYQQMQALGWRGEGVVMCSPQ